MRPLYEDGLATVYHGDCREILPTLWGADSSFALVTDPPYGIDYRTGQVRREGNARSIAHDTDTAVRDWVLEWWGSQGPALVFGSWRVEKPAATKGVLVWDKGGALGMGDLSIPWKFDHEEIYVLGGPWAGRRDSGSVLRCPPEQSMGRSHPHQKPVRLMSQLLSKIHPSSVVIDPCCGVGSTLVAAKARNMRCIGIELDEGYCETAAERLAQGVLDLSERPTVDVPPSKEIA